MSDKAIRKHTGAFHMFTNRSGSNNITLMAGPGETLLIDGSVTNGFPLTDSITYTSKSIAEPSADITGPTDFVFIRQGSNVSLDPTKAQLFTGSTATDFPDSLGMISSGSDTNTWTTDYSFEEEPAFESQQSLSYAGSVYDNTMSFSAREQQPDQFPVYVYKKTLGTWLLDQTIMDLGSFNSSLYNNTILWFGSGVRNASVWTRATEADDFTEQQLLDHYALDQGSYRQSAQLCSDLIVMSAVGDMLRVYRRVASTWTLIYSASNCDYVTCSDTFICSYSLATGNIAVYSVSGSTVSFLYEVAAPGLIDLKVFNDVMTFVTTTQVHVYKLFTTFASLVNSKTTTNISSVTINSSHIAVGRGLSQKATVWALEDIEGTNTNSITSTVGSMSLNSSGSVLVTNPIGSSNAGTGALVVAGSIGTAGLYATSATVTGLAVTGFRATSATIGSLNVSNAMNISAATIGTLTVTNVAPTNVTATNLNVTSLSPSLMYSSEFGSFTNATDMLLTNNSWTNNGGQYTGSSSYRPPHVSAGFTQSGGEFTITRSGLFLLQATVTFAGNGNGRRGIVITANNGVTSIHYAANIIYSYTSDPISLSASCVNLGLAGKVYQVFVFQDSGGNINMINVPTSFFTITRLTDYT